MQTHGRETVAGEAELSAAFRLNLEARPKLGARGDHPEHEAGPGHGAGSSRDGTERGTHPAWWHPPPLPGKTRS